MHYVTKAKHASKTKLSKWNVPIAKNYSSQTSNKPKAKHDDKLHELLKMDTSTRTNQILNSSIRSNYKVNMSVNENTKRKIQKSIPSSTKKKTFSVMSNKQSFMNEESSNSQEKIVKITQIFANFCIKNKKIQDLGYQPPAKVSSATQTKDDKNTILALGMLHMLFKTKIKQNMREGLKCIFAK